MKNGQGRYEYRSKLVYEGTYKKGYKCGEGILFNSDKTICYQGHFDDGVPNGQGKVTVNGELIDL